MNFKSMVTHMVMPVSTRDNVSQLQTVTDSLPRHLDIFLEYKLIVEL